MALRRGPGAVCWIGTRGGPAAVRARGGKRRYCTEERATTTTEATLGSGAIVQKSVGGASLRADVTQPGDRKMWFLKEDGRNNLAPYNRAAYTGGDKGLPLTVRGAREHPDERDPANLGSVNKQATEMQPPPVSAERRSKQLSLLAKNKQKKSLAKLFGSEDGMVTVRRDESVVMIEIMGSKGRLTGGLVDQIEEVLRQVHNMKEVVGVVFSIKGRLLGVPNMTKLDGDVLRQCSHLGQKVGLDLLNTQMITVCVVDNQISGSALELMLSCDFIFATDHASFDLAAARRGQVNFMGGLSRLAAKTSPRTALLVAAASEPLSSEECQRLGLVDRIIPRASDPATAASHFLAALPADCWRTMRQLKDITTLPEQHHMREGLTKEQYYFSMNWNTVRHKEQVDSLGRSL
ncbi:hypothetical protein DIPPA_34926 [Diplonema papillatum]|nr:hypothetical protein DIPPA_34926 [Diplonema papillatum]